MKLQNAIFDMDGTLLDSMGFWKDVAPNLLRQQGIVPPPDLYDRLKVMTLEESAVYCRAHFGLSQTAEEIVRMVADQVKDFYCARVRPKPGVPRFLSALAAGGVKMYVATNTDRPLAEAALKHTGLDRYFPGLLTCAEVGYGKENPAIYEQALRRIGAAKADTVVFEDSLFALRTAKAAGFRVAGIFDPSEEDQAGMRAAADYYIRSYEDLCAAGFPA